MTNRFQIYVLLVAFAGLLVLPFVGSRYSVELATQIMIFGLLATSLNILVGYLGAASFGHAAFFAIGGYACAYFLTTLGWPLVVSMIGAVLLTALASLVIGFFCVRLNEIYFSMLTLAFSMLIWAIALKWKPVTGGDDGFVGVAVPEYLSNYFTFFLFTLGIVSISMIVLMIIGNSTMGRVFIAIRENQTRASFLGVNVRRMRLIAFVIAGTFAGIAGTLLALYVRGMYPETAFWSQSGHILIMVLLGGMHAFIGPFLGASALTLLEVTVGQYTEYWQIVVGIILVVVVLAASEGIYGLARSITKRLGGQKDDDA
ncbi:MAG: branched-chain amino acid ABC transporter permease [Rhodobacteraceae bacterium]|nr:branched-chain amino acid ABC transporter permease [Paracoccaceae bacterium]